MTNWRAFGITFVAALLASHARGELPSPVLQHVFPAGGQAGTTIRVTVEGSSFDDLATLRFSDPRVVCQKVAAKEFAVALPADLAPGVHDVRAVGKYGVSGPRAFQVGNRAERSEVEPNDSSDRASSILSDVPLVSQFVNGRFEKPGDVDCYRFTARAGQLIVLDLWAERIDSPIHGAIEVYDSTGRRLAVNRGSSSVDPRVDFHVPADGEYVVKLYDQTYLGGADYVYRLDVDTGPRVEFSRPGVVRAGEIASVTLWGRNLTANRPPGVASHAAASAFERIEVELPRASVGPSLVPRSSTRTLGEGFSYHHPGAAMPILIGVTDLPVVVDVPDNHEPHRAQQITVPCEVSGQLADCDELDWYSLSARKGEVIWIEALGTRIGSPVDLEISVVNAEQRELVRLTDHAVNLGGTRFPTAHTDPAGRFVAPADGTYSLVVRNVIGGPDHDPRRVYRLVVRREEPDFQLTVVPRRFDQPTGINVWRGGRELADVFAIRRQGMNGAIRVTAENLPAGVDCPEVWLAAGEDRAIVVLTAQRDAAPSVPAVIWRGRADLGGVEVTRVAQGGTMVRAGHPSGWGRVTQETPVGVGPDASVLVTATVHAAANDSTVFQDSIFDVLVDVERRAGADGPIEIRGIGLPRGVTSAVATIPAGSSRGWLSFATHDSIPEGPFTCAIQADLVTTSSGAKTNVTTFSNPLSLRVAPGQIRVTVDPRTPRKIARGQVIQVKYKAERQLGFIGKIHTELAAPGGVVGIRGRGVTFTSQTESGEIQVIATENAPLGQLVFLRLEAIGTVEDQPVYRGGCFVELEIIE